MGRFYDIHCHIFNISHVPMKPILRRNGWKFCLFLGDLSFTRKDDYLRKYVKTCEKRVVDILSQLVSELRESEYTKDKEIILTPLLLYFEREDPVKKIEDQISDIRDGIEIFLKKNSGVYIYPFLGVDPSSEDALEIVKKYVVRAEDVEPGDFIGLKIYPPLNFNLDNKEAEYNIDVLFSYCADYSIPITTHCAGGGFISESIKKKDAENFSSPLKWKSVLDKFPKIKVNLAHFGDFEDKWRESIVSLLEDQNFNVYADVSYAIVKENILGKTKKRFKKLRELLEKDIVRDRILFGSDYYMSLLECGSYSEIIEKVRDGIGDENLTRISEINPEKFLGIYNRSESILSTEIIAAPLHREDRSFLLKNNRNLL